MVYFKLYNNKEEFAAAETVTPTEEYVSSIIPGVAAIKEDKKNAWYNQVPSNRHMSIEELVAEGYADFMQDWAASSPTHYESAYTVIQIHSNCPIKLENITDFDTYLESATTFVWREALPSGWDPNDLAAKYSSTQLARPPMEEMFNGVNMASCSAITLSFKPAGYHVCDTSILTHRHVTGSNYATTPENVTITIRNGSDYSSVFQTSLSEFRTTKHITLNCGQGWGCHDVVGMFEYNPELTGLTFTGRWYGYTSRWNGGMMGMMNMFAGCSKLIEVPLLNSDLARDHEYNMFFPRFSNGWDRGTHCISGMFSGCTALTSIKPTFNMLCTRSGASENAFNCPNLTDVRFKNINNSDYDFTGDRYYIPRMDVASIQYLIDNLATQQYSANFHALYWTDSAKTGTTETDTGYPAENNSTITFSDLHQSEISQSYIDAAAAKGWTIAFRHVDLS